MIHDLHTVDRARAFRVTAAIADVELEGYAEHGRGPVVIKYVATRCARQVVDALATLALDARVEDMRTDVDGHDDARQTTSYVTRWAPSTHVVQLLGGHRDGDLLEVADLRDLRFSPPPDLAALYRDAPTGDTPTGDTPIPASNMRTVDYRLAGWDDVAHRWIMRAS